MLYKIKLHISGDTLAEIFKNLNQIFMKRNLTALCAALLVGLPIANAARVTPAKWQETRNADTFRWAPKSKAVQSDWHNLKLSDKSTSKAGIVTDSDVKMDPTESFYYLDMPDGKTWFVSTEFDKEVISQSDYYVEYDITGVKATVYNEKYEAVGRIEAEIDKPEGFSKCSAIQFGPCVTKKFFNTDDSYEVMLMASFKPEEGYGAVPFTYVYSLKGVSTPAQHVTTLPGYYVVAVNNAADAWSEDFFMEFFTGEQLTDTELLHTFDIYTKASYSSPTASKLQSFTVDMVYVMSDGENEMMPVTLNSNGKDLYVTVAKYEKTFFEDPFDFTNDKLSEDNHFLIDLYKKGAWDNELKLVSNTSIPVQSPEEGFTMRSYCLGAFDGYRDITFDFTDDGNPAFIISVLDTDIYENSLSYFDVVDTTGSVIKSFGASNQGFIRLNSVKGASEQYCFLMPAGNAEDELEFAFYNYPSMEKAASVPVSINYENYMLPLSLALDRVPDGESYSYAVASVNGISDENNNTSHLVAWFDKEGQFTRMDRLNAGKNVNRINPYISANGLDPYLMNTDDAHEYMIFAQRLNNTGETQAHTELMIVNDREEVLFQYPFDTRDSGINVAIVNEATNPAIWVSYNSFEDGANHNEFIKLPLNKFDGSGSVEDPYLIRTRGDFEQIGFNLNANYRLANDIDYHGAEFKPVKGLFTGSVDGAGHTVRNFTLNGNAMFSTAGSASKPLGTFFKDITLRNITATDARAILTENAYAAEFDKVNIINVTVSGGNTDNFGNIAGNAAVGCVISNSAVKADIDLPQADGVGGIVATLGNDSKITATSFNGSISASSTVGGIAADGFASASISDCHVTAAIHAGHTAGGVIGSSARSAITRCFVEGTITADTPRMMWSDYAGTSVACINVGGIAGILNSAPVEYDDNGNPKVPDPNLPPVISKCVVGLEAINIPSDNEKLIETAHRIVGRSSVNNDPAYLGEEYDEDLGDWVITWGDPSPAEDKLADNYVIEGLQPLHSAVEAGHNTTEGKTVAYDNLDRDFFETLGFGFMGYSKEEPWVMRGTNLPALYFEGTVGQYMEFVPGSVSAIIGNNPEVLLVLEDIDFESLVFESSDESGCYANPIEIVDNGVKVEIVVTATGDYTITATNGNISALLLVSGLSGVDAVEINRIMSYDGSTLRADGCALLLYNLQGMPVAEGRDALDVTSLESGVYVAVATDADGTRRTLKINVR